MFSLRSIGISLALLIAAACAQAQVNPNYPNINWKLATGSGAPSGGACTSANYGQPYTQTTGPHQFVCTPSGWLQVDGSSGSGGPEVCADTSGSGTAQVCTTSPTFIPAANSCVIYTTTTTNSGVGLTINVNSLGAKSAAIPGSSGWTTTLTASILPANKPLIACYDGTNWNVVQTGSSSGSASLPTAASPGQIISSTAAGTSYAAQGQVFYNQTGDTISSIESECSSACTYVVTVPQTITLGSSHTLNANVNLEFMAGGKWTVNGAFTLTIPGNVSGTLNTHFAGSSTIKFGDLEALVPFEWFGAIGDGSTNSTTAMQACVNALTSGQCLLQAETYVTSAALTITASSVGIRGTSFGPGSGTTAVSSIIKSTSASADVVDVSGSGAISYSAFQNFATDRSATPTGTATGLSFTHTCGLLVDNTQSFHSVRAYYFGGAAACGTGRISNNQAVTISGGYGFYVDSSAFGPNSMRMNSNTAGVSGGGAGYGFYFNGAPQDLMMDRSETAGETYGVYMDCSIGGTDQDIHIRNGIWDTAETAGIYLNACSGVEIEGGWVSNGGSASAAIDVEGGSHVTIQKGLQILGPGWSQAAIYLNGVTQSAVQGVNFLGNACGACIKLNNSNNNTITSNVIGSNGYGIYLAGSSNNVVMANAIDANGTFAGIFLDSSSINNRYANLNQFKLGTSTPISDAGTGNELVNSLNGTVTYTSSQTASASDNGKLVIMNCSTACAYTLPGTQPSSTWSASIQTVGSTDATITLGGGDTYNGSASVPVLLKFATLPLWGNSATSTDYRGGTPLVQGANVTVTSAPNGQTVAASSSGGGGNYINLFELLSGAPTASGCTISGSAPKLCTAGSAVASVTISSLPAGYNKLIVTVVGGGTNNSTDWFDLRFNGDSGSHYWSQAWCPAINSGTNANGQSHGFAMFNSNGSGPHQTSFTLTIPNYSVVTTDGKSYDAVGQSWGAENGGGGGPGPCSSGGWWNDGVSSSYPAITSLTILMESGNNIAANTTFEVEATN